MSARLARPALALWLLVSCSAPQGVAPSPTSTGGPLATATASSAPLPAGATAFTVVAARSLATIRVREQIAAVPAPGDAVLTTSAFSGSLVLLSDGTFTADSVIAADLDSLESDNDLRDEWIKVNTLQTRLYPRAELRLARVTGVPMPLPARGEWSAMLEGRMKIHGVERALSWPVTVTRVPGEVRARGATAFAFGDYGMAVPANRLILSVVDDVRLEIDVVAREV